MAKRTTALLSALALAAAFGVATSAEAGGYGHSGWGNSHGNNSWNSWGNSNRSWNGWGNNGHSNGWSNYQGNKWSYRSNVHINQNGNGCRNRCYGNQIFNAGWGNSGTITTKNIGNW